MHVPACSLPSRPRRPRRPQALAGACIAAAIAVGGCQAGRPAQPAAATPTGKPASTPGTVTIAAAPPPTTLADCRTLTPALCYGVRPFRVAYGIESLLSHGTDGRGQNVVLLEFSQPSGKTSSDVRRDLALFDGIFGLPPAQLQVITRFAGASAPYQAGGEEAMDAEMVHAVAPGATIRIILLPPGNGDLPATATSFTDALRLAPSLGGVVAITAGVGEHCSGTAGVAQLNAALQANEARHVTVIASSGDNGAAAIPCPGAASSAAVKGVNLPAADPLVLAAGGTNLQANHMTGSYLGETAWTQPGARLPAGVPTPAASSVGAQELLPMASNGGFSALFPRPAYQDGVPGIGSMRGVPDVSADAAETTGMAILLSVATGNVITAADGTSAAAPFWAGIVALADQYAGHALGFINPAIYRIGRSSEYHRAFHDITAGDNTVTFPTGIVTGYRAAPGWDPVTGWGSPDAQVLVPLLAAGG